MNFQGDLAELVMAGKKTETRRLLSDNPRSPWYKRECGFKVGRDYAVCRGRGKGPQIGRIEIIKTFQQPLDEIDEAGAVAEGCADVAEYFELFEKINGALARDIRVWVVRFEVKT